MIRSAKASTAKLTFAAVLAALTLTLTPAFAADSKPQTVDLTPSFRSAGVTLDNLRVTEIGGIVVIRGRAADANAAQNASAVAESLGYTRVANLVQIAESPDDADIARRAERELARHRSLDGCQLAVDSHDGVVVVSGKVQYELQKDAAVEILRNLDGVRRVQTALARF